MHDKIDLNYNELENEIRLGNFVRAALIGEQLRLPEEEIRDLCYKAIGQMAVVYRNAHGTKRLARQYEFFKEETKKVLDEFAEEMKKEGNTKPLERCYDYLSCKYLSFKEWVDQFLKSWDKLSI